VLSAFAFQAAAMRVLEELLAQRIRHFRLEQRLGLGGSLLASLLAFYLLAALYHGLKDGLARMEERLKALGAGDLTREVQVGTRDELQVLAQDLNQAMGGLRTLAAGLREGTAVVQAASAEAAEWSGRLSAMTASQIDEVDHAAYSVSALAPSAARARQEATAASQAAERVDAGLRSLQEAGLRAAQVMDGLKASAVQVARIAEGMEALAFQAKLVAAGALGRLEEGGRTPGVSDLIAELHGLGVRGAAAAQDLRASLLEGAALNAQGGAALAAALDAAHRVRPDFGAVTAFVREVGDAAQTLAERLGELGEILARIGGLTGDHADQARQLGASARTLAEQAQSLSGLAEHFRL